MHQRCSRWIQDLRASEDISSDLSKSMCFECHNKVQSSSSAAIQTDSTSFLQKAATLALGLGPNDFQLPTRFLENLPLSKSKPIEKERLIKVHKKTKRATSYKLSPIATSSSTSKRSAKRQHKRSNSQSPRPLTVTVSMKDFSIVRSSLNVNIEEKERNDETEDDCHPTSTCSRIIPHDPSKKLMRSANNSAAHARSALAAMRSGGKKGSDRGRNQSDDKGNSRKSRVNQRRMLKDTAVFGEIKDKLAGCEHALRFGKSLIHGWGVFTDEHISKGDFIVEYRGVLIGHAVANKREKEYEEAKIGSDYMFRISNSIVCDATHEGNVTRFINACCSPNCQTKILVVNGVKRIAVYAKKDIHPGEELSYDYKFQPEFDESKRIPCNCGAPDCRKFMNWDYRYVDVSRISDVKTDGKPRTKNIN
jgi:histone-lysine N-methyltransferase SETD1